MCTFKLSERSEKQPPPRRTDKGDIRMKYVYPTQIVCSQAISFDLDGNKVSNIQFFGGCNGNLKAISKLVDGWEVEKIESYLKGNLCGSKPTSCADQLALGVRAALDGKLRPAE